MPGKEEVRTIDISPLRYSYFGFVCEVCVRHHQQDLIHTKREIRVYPYAAKTRFQEKNKNNLGGVNMKDA
jgi:hypothetical protein